MAPLISGISLTATLNLLEIWCIYVIQDIQPLEQTEIYSSAILPLSLLHFFFFFLSGFLMPLTWTSKSQVLTLPRIVTDNTWQSPPVNSYIEGLACSRQRTGSGALASGSWGNQLIRNPSYKQNKFYPKINRMCIQCS